MIDPVPADVQTYLDGIAAEHLPMWDRVVRLVRDLYPDVELRMRLPQVLLK